MPEPTDPQTGQAGSQPAQAQDAPLVLIPVQAEDVERRNRRIHLSIWFAAIAALAIAGFVYKHYTDPLHAQESYDSGVRLLSVARYDQAILSFDRAARLEPGKIDAYLMRGRAYVGISKPEEAVRDFSRVLELRPADTTAMVERGLVYLDLKDFQSALAGANRALALDPKLSRAYNLRGLTIRAMGDPAKALEDFTTAVNLDPNVDNYFQRGATLQVMGDHKRAIRDFDQVIALKPDGAPAYFARAGSRRALGDLKGGEEDHRHGRMLDGR